jgi:hypothetical protein
MSKTERFANATDTPVPDNTNIMTAGRRGPAGLNRPLASFLIALPAQRGVSRYLPPRSLPQVHPDRREALSDARR